MINFIYTIIICLFNCFGWYDLANNLQQKTIDAQSKNAYLYTDRIVLSFGDLTDYYRFNGFLSYLESTKGTDFVSNSTWSVTYYNSNYLDNNEPSDIYITNTFSFSNMSSTSYSRLVEVKDIVISKAISTPVQNRMGYYYYSFVLHDFGGNTILSLACMKYITTPPSVSGTLLDNPTYFWTIDYNGFYRNPTYLSDSWEWGVVFNYSNDLYYGFRSKGLPIDETDEWETGYESGYGFGYTDGYDEGVNVGNNQGYQSGYNAGNTAGYQNGYNAGLSDGQSYDQTALTIFTGIIEVGLLPVNIFLQMFNYEIFGINISGVVSALLTISIVIIIVRFLLGKKDD